MPTPSRADAPPTRPSGTTAPTSSCGPTPASLAPGTASCATRDSPSGEALVFAYRAYQAATLPPYRISLDRAFNLVSYIDGIWLANAPALSVLTCPGCGCEFIAAVGTVAHPGEPCPFCKLLERFHLDHRIQASYPARPALDMTERQLGMLALFHKLSPEAEGDSPSE
jgi:flagellar transcriptional activator FlhC